MFQGGYRKHVLSVLLKELRTAGVKREDLNLIVATGIYKKPNFRELAEMLSKEILGE